MSINSMTSRDTIEIRRQVVSSGSGEAKKTWTTGARGALPSAGVKCRMQANRPKDALEYGCRADVRSWRLYFGESGDPKIDARDRVYLTDTDGVAHECLVKSPSFSFDSLQARLWLCVVESLGFAK